MRANNALRHPVPPVIHNLFFPDIQPEYDDWHRHIDTGHRDIVKIINRLSVGKTFPVLVPAAFRKVSQPVRQYPVRRQFWRYPRTRHTIWRLHISFDERTRIDVADSTRVTGEVAAIKPFSMANAPHQTAYCRS